ncbi:hypothetical protein OJAV_G00077700 [Oryzias javanicus]|uniref:Uncharacterized protein n=1 Tax=Oryzias javanicus TaxID=123683 RepID=A0A3S2MY23_ORYJA|nr:hypothetical protein OJAV_G00077700 [Oryzias javanicus]
MSGKGNGDRSIDHTESHSSGFNSKDHQSYEYDVLPCRAVQKISTPTKMDDVYDSPRSFFKYAEIEEPTYDVPSSLLRTTFCTIVSESSSEEETH